MNFEVLVVEHGWPFSLILIFIATTMLALLGFWRRDGKMRWLRFFGVFLVSVLTIWGLSEIVHEYALWRVSVYDADGVQPFASDDQLGPELYRRLMEIVVHDTGNALQPLGAVVMSSFFLMVSQALAHAVGLVQR